MRGGWRLVAVAAGIVLFSAACTSTIPTANNSPASSPSSVASPSQSPSASPSVAASPSTQPSGPSLAVSSLPVHNGEVGVGYLAVTFGASGGTPPYSWSVAGGLPPGLALSSQGVLTGTDTTSGHFSFTAQVTDSTGATATGPVSMTVFPPLTVTQRCVNGCYVGMGCTTCGRFGTVSGGAGPYHYKLAGGAIPTGMTMNGFALQGPFPVPQVSTVPVEALTTGPPITQILWPLSASVTDDFGVTKTVSASFLEFFPLNANCSSALACSCQSHTCSGAAGYLFGSPSDQVSVEVTSVCLYDPNTQGYTNCTTSSASFPSVLPSGWTTNAKVGSVNILFDAVSFNGVVTVELVDRGACVAPGYATSNPINVTINYAT